MIRLAVFKESPLRVPRGAIARLFKNIIREETSKRAQGKINLIFTTDNRIQRLNKKFRGKDKPTDVLSFNLNEPSGTKMVCGEIYISVPTSARQARENGNSLNEEFLRLFCHGLLHLMGYDHIKARERRKMKVREQRHLRLFKVRY